MGKLRFLLALWLGKLSIPALKITHHNGTDFPGSLAVKVCPDFLKDVGKPPVMVAVTGTNGKTTVSNMLVDILEAEGHHVLSNRAGSNITSGVSTAFIRNCDLLGRVKQCDMAVLEIDERSAPKIYPYVRPNYILITNLFRDSIMRNAHPGYIADILSRNLPRESKLILNADDLISCGVAEENDRCYFGIGRMPGDVTDCVNLLNDMRICPRCAGKLRYDYRRYHHIGHAVCESCGFHSPEADYLAEQVDLQARTMVVREKNGVQHPYDLITDSLFNIYNMMAVIAALRQLGLSHDTIRQRFAGTKILESRLSEESIGGVNVIMQMSKDKNALACSRNFDYIRSKPGRKELLVMMNCMGVSKNWSENPSWMYDTDFEFLNHDDIVQLVCAGPRARDYKLRLLLAGIPEEKIFLEDDEFKALDKLYLTPGDDVYILYGVDGTPLAFRVKARLKELLLAKGGQAQ